MNTKKFKCQDGEICLLKSNTVTLLLKVATNRVYVPYTTQARVLKVIETSYRVLPFNAECVYNFRNVYLYKIEQGTKL